MASRVLIADDEPNIVISLEFLMKQQGYVTLKPAASSCDLASS
jgi:hypothetical protein